MKPYYSCAYGDLYRGDCLEVMPLLGQKVDLVLTDPPYGKVQCKWDSVIPFEDMWKSLSIVTGKETPKVLFGSEPFSSLLRCSNIKEFKYDWIWDKVKGTGFLNARRQPMRNHEILSVFYEKQCLYNPLKTKGHVHKKSYRSKDLQTEVYGNMNNDYTYSSTERYPRSIQVFSTDTQNSSIHATQKPVALLEYLIRTYSLPQQLVLDFTAGSSSTAIACINTNRKFIMIEKEEKYCEISAKRIEEHINKMWGGL